MFIATVTRIYHHSFFTGEYISARGKKLRTAFAYQEETEEDHQVPPAPREGTSPASSETEPWL